MNNVRSRNRSVARSRNLRDKQNTHTRAHTQTGAERCFLSGYRARNRSRAKIASGIRRSYFRIIIKASKSARSRAPSARDHRSASWSLFGGGISIRRTNERDEARATRWNEREIVTLSLCLCSDLPFRILGRAHSHHPLFIYSIPPRRQGRAPLYTSRASNLYPDERGTMFVPERVVSARAHYTPRAVYPLPAASSHDLVKDTRRSLSRLCS